MTRPRIEARVSTPIAADVDADEDDRLPEPRPVRAHVDGGQAGHADGRHRGEQRIGERRPLSVGRRGGHREQRGEERDQSREDQDGEPGGGGGRQIAEVIPHSPDAPTQRAQGRSGSPDPASYVVPCPVELFVMVLRKAPD